MQLELTDAKWRSTPSSIVVDFAIILRPRKTNKYVSWKTESAEN